MSKEAQLEGLRQLVGNLEQFSFHCLKIADKTGNKVPFVWNDAQRYVHARLEEQRKTTGKVRAIILKGRQQGMSTYVAARFYHRVTTNFGQRALIVGHEQKSTDSLFSMVKRYHENNLFPVSTSNTNAKELIFDKLEGGYKLATAGTQDVGRGNTSQVAHLSEFAFWSNAQMHMAGLGNTIADLAGTEIVIESTANGLGNGYHDMWQEAESGRSEFIAIFVPWFWQPEYRAPIREDRKLTSEDVDYQQAYGLDAEQMQWRANKIATYGAGFEWLFDQEYPASPSLAFRTSTKNPLISPSLVMAAVNNVTFSERYGSLLIGCDPAGEGDDRTAIAFRQGRTVFRVEYHSKLDTMQVAGKLAEYYRTMQPDAIFVDKVGLGAGVYDRLRELQIPVIGVGAGMQANNKERYENKRAEMWFEMQKWFADAPVRIPNDAALIADLSTLQALPSSNGRCALEKKSELRKRGIRSPDGADALALTFAEPVAGKQSQWMLERSYQAPTSAGY
jgi:hypothetical protein